MEKVTGSGRKERSPGVYTTVYIEKVAGNGREERSLYTSFSLGVENKEKVRGFPARLIFQV